MMFSFWIGVLSTLLVLFGCIGAFLSVLGAKPGKLALAISIVIAGVTLPFIVL